MAMNAVNPYPLSAIAATATETTAVRRRQREKAAGGVNGVDGDRGGDMGKKSVYSKASCLQWSIADAVHVARFHWMPCLFALGLLFFMAVEYTLRMVPSSSPPVDLGFLATRPLHRVLQSSPELNTLLAGLNTVRRRFTLCPNLRSEPNYSSESLTESSICSAFSVR